MGVQRQEEERVPVPLNRSVFDIDEAQDTESDLAVEDSYEAVGLQQGLLFHNAYEPGSGVDLVQVTIDWPEPLDLDAMSTAWQHATERYAILRTAFAWSESGHEVVQRVYHGVRMPVESHAEPDGGEPAERISRFLAADRARDFDPTVAPLARVSILRHAPDRYTLVVSFHHAILDGRALLLLLTEVFTEYAALRSGVHFAPPPRRPFRDFSVWAAQRPLDADRRYWLDQLDGVTLPTPLPLFPAAATPPRQPTSVREISRTLRGTTAQALHEAAARAGVSLSAMANAAWALLLHRYSGERDVVFGSVRSCRRGSVEGADTTIGMLVNTIPLRIGVPRESTVRDWLVEIRRQLVGLREHQATPLTQIVRWTGLPPTDPLFETLLMYEHRELRAALADAVPGWDGRDVAVHRHPGPAVTVCVFGGTEPRVLLYHDRRRLADEAADRMLDHFTTCLGGLAAGLDGPVAAVPMLDPDEQRRLTREWAGDFPPYPADSTIDEQFAAQVRRTPDAVAVTGPDGTLSYAELDRRANRLARLLLARGVAADTPVAVAMSRSVRQVVALLAVLKAGAAYLPLDPADPPARIRALLAASGNPPVLTSGDAVALPGDHPRIDADADLTGLPDTAPPRRSHPESLAYVSHTSGSTGAPKGVAVPHRAVLRLVHRPDYLRLGPDERVLHLAPVAFDAATLELWGSLLNGACLVVAPAGPLGPAELGRLLRTERISVLWLTAGLFHQVVETAPDGLAGVGQLLAGGDVLDPGAVRTALRVRGGQPLVNGYGPTENTTFTCCHRMTDPDAVPDPVPIGRPVPRTTVYVLDDQLRPVPVGVPGELYTGGDGLARGYLGRPGLTAERFLPDPFSRTPGARMYRTGDRVRWRPDGTLEFLGRVDRQVKIRGFRVEPAEVEAVLRAHPAVGEAAVVVDGDGERRRLLAYLTPAAGGPAPDTAGVAAYAATRLPPYLCPAGYVVLPALPLNRNGKVDRKALPAPPPPAAPPVAPPTDPTQAALAALWTELLGVGVGHRDDDFFALGGNSLLATRLAFLAAERFGVELPIRAVYDCRTLAGLAAEIDRRRATPANGQPAIVARDRARYRVRTAVDHLVRPTPGRWAMWRWVGLRAAGFPIEPLIRLGDPRLVAAADAVQQSEEHLARARREMIDLLRQGRLAGRPDERSRWNRADRQVRQGGLPDPMPYAADEALARRLAEARHALADALDGLAATEEAFTRAWQTASADRSAALRAAAADPRFREAVTWQNRHAVRTGLDRLLAGDPASRDSQRRQHEALVATYLQRYCAKNDTIGFFGPVGWARITDQDAPLRVEHGAAPLATRTVYFENWAVAELAEVLTHRDPALRPWLVPRRLPFVAVDDGSLRLPLTPPIPLSPATARLLAACDGVRTAGDIAAELVADPDSGLQTPEQVYELLAQLRDARRITWSLEVPKEDLFPERALRQRLGTVDDPAVREPAMAALDELVRTRDEVAAAAGDPDRLGAALAGLEETFTRLTGNAPTRRAGRVYAGRTLVYEDCRAGTEVTLSPALTATLWPALGLLLDSARWFTFAGAALFRRACQERYRELVQRGGESTVPFADFWLWANDLLFDLPERLVAPVVRGLRDRWARILPPIAAGTRRVEVASADIAERVAAEFAAPRPGWAGAYQHSPDVMLAAASVEAIARGDFRWVVGEVHPGVNTLRSALFVAQHPRPAELVAAMETDLPGPRVVLAATGEEGGAPARLTDKLVTDRDLRLVFGHDSCGLDPRTSVAVADCVLEERGGALVVRSRDGRYALPLAEVVGEALMIHLLQRFDIRQPADHQPRITVDRVVIARETWRFAAGDLDFADTADEATRFRQVRRWQRASGLPRYVFVGTPVEKKPFFVDFASLAAVDGLARAVRRTVRSAGPDAVLRFSEMLPRPDQLWLTDADGNRRTAEFRLVAVDRPQTPEGIATDGR
jgi:amino acid adenylation domain-containing protein